MLSFEDYKALTKERTAMEERYEEAVGRHNDWKTARAKEARVEKLRQDKLACLLKVEALKKEKEEAERRAEEERKAEAKRKEDERVAKELKEKEEATECKRLEDLEAKEKEKEKEDEANELALQVAGAPSASDGDTEEDPADPKTAAMAELRKRRAITEGKKRAHSVGSRKRKVQSASLVDDSEVEGGNVSAGPSTPKRLKTEPAPQANDKVFSGMVHRSIGAPFCLLTWKYFVVRCGKCWADKANCFIRGGIQTCQRCHVKKAWCSFNKGSDDGGSAESTTIMELLQDISSRLARLEDKVEQVVERVEDLMDDYHPDHNVKYPDDLPSKSMMAEFEASRLELRKTGDIYSEVLCQMGHTTFGQGYGGHQGEGVAVTG